VSRHERWEARDRTYSSWHRYACADYSTMIDVDGLDYCQRCRMPLLLVEAARDCGQDKPTIVLEKLAASANVTAWCVLWTPAADWNPEPPHCECQRQRRVVPGCGHGIESMRIRRVYPNKGSYQKVMPLDVARWIDRVHENHERDQCQFAFSAA